jgi:hypothetical protein
MKSFIEYLKESCDCWKGYKRKPGTKPCAEGSCVKEEVNIDEAVGHTIEAHGIKGAKGTPWRKTFKSHDHLHDWAEKNDSVEIHATRDLEGTKKKTNEETSIDEAAVDAKGHKSSTGGLTQKGRDAYNAKGAHLQAPVTTPPSKLKKGSKSANRRKSFCARMSGMEGAMKKPNGEPTRKALALRKWNC